MSVVRMLKTILFLAIATVQCFGVEDKLNEDPMVDAPALQDQRVYGFHPRSDWSYYYPSWASLSGYFKKGDVVEKPPEFLERLTAVEQVVKEITDILKKHSIGPKKNETTTSPRNKTEALTSNESPPAMKMDKEPQDNVQQPLPGGKKNPESIDQMVEQKNNEKLSIDKKTEDVATKEKEKEEDKKTNPTTTHESVEETAQPGNDSKNSTHKTTEATGMREGMSQGMPVKTHEDKNPSGEPIDGKLVE